MNDYIRREDALKSIDTHDKFIKEDIRTLAKEYYEYKCGVDYAYEKIKHDVPAADVVEVVRCKDCVSCKVHKCNPSVPKEYRYKDMLICQYDDCEKDPNHFCAYGERKEVNK